MGNLTQRSVEIILDNQVASGTYTAGPNFRNYHYCWFRDGSFITYAMDLVGEHASAARFHDWVVMAINRRARVFQWVVDQPQTNEPLSSVDLLHIRYTLNREDATSSEWLNFQMAGFRTWMWALGEHFSLTSKSLLEAWERAAGLAANYLSAL